MFATALFSLSAHGSEFGKSPIPVARATVRDLTADDIGFTVLDRANTPNWGPEQAAGPPNVPQAGSNALAWTSLGADDQPEWLLCDYAKAIDVRAVIVHANAFPGAVSKVSAFNADGDEIVAWEGEDPVPRDRPRGVSVIPIKLNFPVQRIRVSIDSPAVSGWNEIDAVGIEDAMGAVHWAKHVESSSTYASLNSGGRTSNGKPSYSPEQVAGAPDVEGPGDNVNAWCPATADQPEWLVCEFKKPQMPVELVVHESMGPGAVTKICVFDAEDKEVTVWEGVDPTPRDQAWGVSVFPLKVSSPFRKLKLYLACEDVTSYQEIDAVGLRELNGDTQWTDKVDASSTYGVSRSEATMRAPAMAPSEQSFRELQLEVQSLRKQVEALQQLKQDLDELKAAQDKLKEKRK